MPTKILITLFVLSTAFLSAGKFDVGYGMHSNEMSHDAGTLKLKERIKKNRVYWQKIEYTLAGVSLTAQFPAKPFPIDSTAWLYTHEYKYTYYQFQPFKEAPDTAEQLIAHYQGTPGIIASVLEKTPKGCTYAIAFERIEEGTCVAKGRDYVFGDTRFSFIVEGDDLAPAEEFFRTIQFK